MSVLMVPPELDRDGLEEILEKGISKSQFCRVAGCGRMSLDRWLRGSDPLSPLVTRDLNRIIKRFQLGLQRESARRLDAKLARE